MIITPDDNKAKAPFDDRSYSDLNRCMPAKVNKITGIKSNSINSVFILFFMS